MGGWLESVLCDRQKAEALSSPSLSPLLLSTGVQCYVASSSAPARHCLRRATRAECQSVSFPRHTSMGGLSVRIQVCRQEKKA